MADNFNENAMIDADEFKELEESFVHVDMRDVKDYVEQNGLHNFKGYIDAKMDEWKQIPLNVAITGESGAGKSTLINTLRNLRATDPEAAAVGVSETTTTPTAYDHPDNPNLKLWDLPGIGTPKFPKDAYLAAVRYEMFDFFLIVSAGRFSENDLFLAKALVAVGKRFVFVRSKVDVDLYNESEDHPDLSERTVKENIRGNIMDNLNMYDIDDRCKVIFLINCKNRQKLEFEILLEYVIHNLPKLKREAMILSLRCLTKGMVREKKEVIRSRIWKASLLSAGIGAVPIPGVNLVGDFTLLIHETIFIIRQLGIDEESLVFVAQEYGTNVPYLRRHVANMAAIISVTTITQETMVTLVRTLSAAGAGIVVDKVTDQLPYLLPGIGSLIAAPVSFATTYGILWKLLEMAAEDAQNVLDAAILFKAERTSFQ